MHKALRRTLATAGTTVAVFALAVGQANAHFCFNEKMSERAQQSAAGSANWISFGDLAFEFTGLCPAGIEILAEAGGVSTTTLIHGNAVMAQGTLREGGKGGNKAIGHLDFDGIDAAFPAAIDACS